MVDLQRGFVLTRHWRDTPAGTEVEFWLATDTGPRRIRLPWQPSVAFIPQAQREQAKALSSQESVLRLHELINGALAYELDSYVRTVSPASIGRGSISSGMAP